MTFTRKLLLTLGDLIGLLTLGPIWMLIADAVDDEDE